MTFGNIIYIKIVLYLFPIHNFSNIFVLKNEQILLVIAFCRIKVVSLLITAAYHYLFNIAIYIDKWKTLFS